MGKVRQRAARALVATAALGSLAFGGLPASAASFDCITEIRNNSAGPYPAIRCAVVQGGEARARADCVAAPDTYTSWINRPGSSIGAPCLFNGVRGSILETRAF